MARLNKKTGRSQAFTLIEIMIVISIVAIVLATGIPSMYRAMRKNALMKASNDIVEGCSFARAAAILQSKPFELVIREDYHVAVQPAPDRRAVAVKGTGFSSTGAHPQEDVRDTKSGAFSSQLPDDVMIRLLSVNFQDYMTMSEAHVRFFPNGTSDEFTILFETKDGQTEVTLDTITAQAEIKRHR